MATETVLEFTDDNFDAEVIQSDVPVLVDFWAEWCQPCRMLTPTIDELANEYKGRVKVGKLDIDTNQQTAMKFNIASIPTVLVLKGGEVHKMFVGLASKDQFSTVLDEIV